MSGVHPQDLSNRPANPPDLNMGNPEGMLNNKQITITNEPIITKRAGRRKINIEFIEDKSRRHITFSKRKAGIMKKAYELSTLTGTQVLLLVASETGHVYTFATPKLQPLITKPEGKNLIQACLNAPDSSQPTPPSQPTTSRMSSYNPPAPGPSAPNDSPAPMLYHPPDQSPSAHAMQAHMYDEKPKIAGFNSRGSVGDTKYAPDPALSAIDYPPSASFNAANMMNPMRVPYHSSPLVNQPPPRSSYSMGSPSANQSYSQPQYPSQPASQYSMPPPMGYPPNFHPSQSPGSSPHLYSANQKPNMGLNVPHPPGAQHPMNAGGDYKYLPSSSGMDYPYHR